MLKILIADDHYMVREGLKSALTDLAPGLILFEAEDLSEVLSLLARHDDFDLVLLDMKMPGMQGIDSLQQVKQAAPAVAVAILSAYHDRQLIQRALDLGADGYISKTSNKEVMLNAIRLILAGEIYVPSALLHSSLLDDRKEQFVPMENAHARALSSLTTRQQEVFLLMKYGEPLKTP